MMSDREYYDILAKLIISFLKRKGLYAKFRKHFYKCNIIRCRYNNLMPYYDLFNPAFRIHPIVGFTETLYSAWINGILSQLEHSEITYHIYRLSAVIQYLNLYNFDSVPVLKVNILKHRNILFGWHHTFEYTHKVVPEEVLPLFDEFNRKYGKIICQ